MKNRTLPYLLIFIFTISACGRGEAPASPSPAPASTSTRIPAAETVSATPAPISSPVVTETPTQTPFPTVESLKAKVIADKLSCRYGPGPLYLYLYALNGTANITLIGRTDANDWVWVDGTNKCWVHSKFLEIDGDPGRLPVVYPGLKLPVSPYYPGPGWVKATRDGNSIEITWQAVPISPGKYENANMQQYLIEVWRCEAGEIIFETLGTNYPAVKVENDEPGCDAPSHGRVFVQEKHGYGGPIEIPWPTHD
jgi:hypothetical protein